MEPLKPNPESEKTPEHPKRRWVQRLWDKVGDFKGEWFDRRQGTHELAEHDDDDEDTPEKPKKRSRWRKFLGLPVRQEVSTEEVRSRSRPLFGGVEIASVTNESGSESSDRSEPAREGSADAGSSNGEVAADTITAASTGESSDHDGDGTTASSVETAPPPGTGDIELPPVDHESPHDRMPRRMPESPVSLRDEEYREASGFDAPPGYERSSPAPETETRYVRDRRAERGAALVGAGLIFENIRRRANDREIRAEAVKTNKRVASQEKAAQRSSTVQETANRQINELMNRAEKQQAPPESRSNTVRYEHAAAVPQSFETSKSQVASAEAVKFVAQPERNTTAVIKEISERRYDSVRPEEVLKKVEKAAAQDEALEGLFERRVEVRDDTKSSTAGMQSHYQEPPQTQQAWQQTGRQAESNGKDSVLQNIQKQLQSNPQMQRAVTGGLWTALGLVILLIVLLLIR